MNYEAGAGFQRARHGAEKLLGSVVTEEGKAVSKAITGVVDVRAFNLAHVTENKFNRGDEVMRLNRSIWPATLIGLRFRDEFLGYIDAGNPQPALRQFKRQSPVAAGHIEHVRASIALQLSEQELGFALRLFSR